MNSDARVYKWVWGRVSNPAMFAATVFGLVTGMTATTELVGRPYMCCE